ncbi:hypothetical protein BPIT_24990 [Candidatus Brocadia pituitae]|nr:hypothetical protein BPIT_24990 [Candidatus Brocadia pituitae]
MVVFFAFTPYDIKDNPLLKDALPIISGFFLSIAACCEVNGFSTLQFSQANYFLTAYLGMEHGDVFLVPGA